MSPRKTSERWEFGDFQTPDVLVSDVMEIVARRGFRPGSVVEPSCGEGSFVVGAAKAFPDVNKFVALDVNQHHLAILQARLHQNLIEVPIQILHDDFFTTDWQQLIGALPEPILITGNPPWVTSSDLSTLQSTNLPVKSNFQGHRGLEALTGKSNFDISEWMLLQYVRWLKGKKGAIAVLCKTSVARKILLHLWRERVNVCIAEIRKIDALKHFAASVDACFFYLEFDNCSTSLECMVYPSLSSTHCEGALGFYDNILVSDAERYVASRSFQGRDEYYTWRSGIKHDCSRIMELNKIGKNYINGEGVSVDLEDTLLFPLLKSSDIGNGRLSPRGKYMLVTQGQIGQDTSRISNIAPQTWIYLQRYADTLASRRSSIYKNRPPFSIFGIGDYTFTPWKLAISGFYKKLHFSVVGPFEGRPIVFDDTVYFLPCFTHEEAVFIWQLLNTEPALNFLSSMTFWEDKRPITIELLKRLNIQMLATLLGRESEYLHHVQLRSHKRATGH